MALSPYGPKRRFINTTSTALVENNFYTLAGLDLYSPDETMKESNSPYARNFRVFENNTLANRVAISKRKGHKKYSDVVGETVTVSQTAVTGAVDLSFGNITWVAQKFTPAATLNLSRISVNMKNTGSGIAPIIITVHKNNAGKPGDLIATSSIDQTTLTSTYGYKDAYFVEAPQLLNATDYWFVLHQQSEGTGTYQVSTTTAASTAALSTDSGNSYTAKSYSLNYNIYTAPAGGVLAIHRFYRTSVAPETIFVAKNATGVGLYRVNDGTGAVTQITVTLSSSAVNYEFVNVNNVCYFVNGVDNPKKYDGSTVIDMPGSPGVNHSIRLHKQALFLLNTSTNKVIYSSPTALETFDAAAYIYIPSPNTADYVQYMEVFQDNLVFMTRRGKYILYGATVSSFVLRESTSVKGVVGPKAAYKFESMIYFVADDFNVYAFNGGTDKAIGTKIGRLLEQVADLTTIQLVVINGLLRIYYTPSGASEQQNCIVDDLSYLEWLHDTEIYVSRAIPLNSQTDKNLIVVGSSRVSRLMYADTNNSDMGKPILFDYWTKYISFGHPTRKHRVKRLYPIFSPGEGPYYATVGVDADGLNSPYTTSVYLGTDSATWGGSTLWGSTATWGGNKLFNIPRINVPGQNTKHQIRFSQYGVDNPTYVIGFSTYTKMRRPI